MKRYLVIAIAFLCVSGHLFAQQGTDLGRLGVDTAQQDLQEISVDKFEHEGFWRATISPDSGFITSRLFYGSPDGKDPLPESEMLEQEDIYVLGARVDFLRRGHTSFYIRPRRPLPVEGITKSISVWAVGRNFNHRLNVLVQDLYGREFALPMGKLNFQGWQLMTVAVPAQPFVGRAGIVQRDFHIPHRMGLSIVGFRVDVDPAEAIGTYYLYLDDLRVVTDLFADNARDPDDISDAW